MCVEWINYKEKRILVTTYTGLSSEKMIQAARKQIDLIQQETGKVLILDDFRDSFASSEFMEIAKELGKTIVGPKTKKNAVLGVTGIKKFLLHAYNIFTRFPAVPFATMEEALDFLAED